MTGRISDSLVGGDCERRRGATNDTIPRSRTTPQSDERHDPEVRDDSALESVRVSESLVGSSATLQYADETRGFLTVGATATIREVAGSMTTIERVDGGRTDTVSADLETGVSITVAEYANRLGNFRFHVDRLLDVWFSHERVLYANTKHLYRPREWSIVTEKRLSDADVREMVRNCRSEWGVRRIERSDHGTDFVCFVTCDTPGGTREAVLKATTADFVAPEIARSEPRLYNLIGERTTIPVPEVYGFVDADDSHPAPYYLAERLPGENFEDRHEELSVAARERTLREAGANLAELHDLGTLPRVGRVGVRESELAVLESEHGGVDDFRAWLRADADGTLNALANGTYYPDLADEPDRFADLVPALRETLESRIDELSAPAPPRYCHWDYRYGNLLLDPDTGETRGVLDWANLLAADPAYNLANTESYMLDARDSPRRTATLRSVFREAYESERDGWSFTPAVEERIDTYLLKCRTDAMACLPLWFRDATPAERDERERHHRAFVSDYL